MKTSARKLSQMQLTAQLGTDFWNDSCHLKELQQAVDSGAVGATSNPVIVCSCIEEDAATWIPILRQLIKENKSDSEDEISWKLIERMATSAAKILKPVYDKTESQKGFLSVQINAKNYRNTEKMFEQGMHLAQLAPNMAIKAPTTAAGIAAMEALSTEGVRINATVSFSVAQALAVAEAMERAYIATKKNKFFQPYVTLMVGRIDDHLKRIAEKEAILIEPDFLHWAGIAVAKKTYQIFKERNFRSKLLIAAYRHHLHWSELIGPNIIQTIPYAWWNKFNSMDLNLDVSITKPVETKILNELQAKFLDFRKAYDENLLKADEFASFGPTVHTLNQFLGGYQKLTEIVRAEMLA